MADFIKIHPCDNVAVALHPITKGTLLHGIPAAEDIPQGHKMSLDKIPKGEMIYKYGFPIGHAVCDIMPGQWVHTHNVKTNLSGESRYTYEPTASSLAESASLKFLGYRRLDGSVGIRNEIWIIPTVGCVNDIAKALARENQNLVVGNIDGLYAYTHPYGCSQTGEDHAKTRKLLASLAMHPNAAAVLILGLGCENLAMDQMKDELGDYDPERIKFLVCQDVSDEMEMGRRLLKECAEFADQFVRTEISADELVIGMKCGGSDGLSGVTANPVVGRFSDMLISQGGTTVLTEVPEMFGAEGLLMNRCANEQIFDKFVDMVNGFKAYYLRHGETVYENPSPGNKAGGITTLEDKSCGCVQKGGSAPVMDVNGYGERIITKGLNLLDGPGNDLVSATALCAARAHIVLFTTGRGTPFGAPVPTLKISTNTQLALKKSGWIDFNAGCVADGTQSIDKCAAELMDMVLSVASGQTVWNEKNGFREISIFKNGVVL